MAIAFHDDAFITAPTASPNAVVGGGKLLVWIAAAVVPWALVVEAVRLVIAAVS